MLINFDLSHLKYFTPRYHEEELFTLFGNMSERIESLASNGEAYSFFKDEKLISFGGAYSPWEGVLEIWMIPSNELSSYKLEACKHLKSLVSYWETKCRRIQTTTRLDEQHDRYMKFLGLEREGILKSFGPKGEDFGIYAKVVE